MSWILIIALGVGTLYATTILLFLAGWLRTHAFQLSKTKPSVKISVIVPVRNEERNMPFLLTDLLKQSYPQNLFEVIVINDHSTDSTAQVLAEFCKKHSNFRFITLEGQKLSGKKTAIEEGIKISRFNLIVTTDGDCRAGKKWLESFAHYYVKNQSVLIMGPVLFNDTGTIWNEMMQLEHLSLQGATAGSCGIQMPVMISGANMAFKKSLFSELQNPLMKRTPSGDDMFLMMNAKLIYRKGIAFLKSAEACIKTPAPSDFDSFWEQRKRWVSKSRFYKDPEVIFTGGVVYLTAFFLFLFFMGSIFHSEFFQAFLILIGLKSFADFLILLFVTSFFKKKYLLWYFLPAQFLYFAYVTLAGTTGYFGAYYWKGRKWKKEKRKL
jgi:poly-beta-1,6-N-acetyl-D-glucosamine synthase